MPRCWQSLCRSFVRLNHSRDAVENVSAPTVAEGLYYAAIFGRHPNKAAPHVGARGPLSVIECPFVFLKTLGSEFKSKSTSSTLFVSSDQRRFPDFKWRARQKGCVPPRSLLNTRLGLFEPQSRVDRHFSREWGSPRRPRCSGNRVTSNLSGMLPPATICPSPRNRPRTRIATI